MAPRRLALAAALLLAISLTAHLPARLFLTEGPAGNFSLERIHGHWRAGGMRSLLPEPAPAVAINWRIPPAG